MLTQNNSLEKAIRKFFDTFEYPEVLKSKYPCECTDGHEYPCECTDGHEYPCDCDDMFINKQDGKDNLMRCPDLGPWYTQTLGNFDSVLNPSVNYNNINYIDENGNVLLKEIEIPVMGVNFKNIDVSYEVIPNKNYWMLHIVSDMKDCDVSNKDYANYVDSILKGKNSTLKYVKQKLDFANKYELDIIIPNSMDPSSIKCFLVDSILKVMIKPKKAEDTKARRIKVDIN